MYRLKIKQGDFANVWEFETLQGVAGTIQDFFNSDNIGEILQNQKQ